MQITTDDINHFLDLKFLRKILCPSKNVELCIRVEYAKGQKKKMVINHDIGTYDMGEIF